MTINRKTFNRALAASSVLTSLMDGNAVSGKAVASAIASIAGIGAKLDNQIHGTAVACIYLSMSVAEGGPASGAGPAVALMNAMPKGSRAKALGSWFAAFSNIRVKLDPKTKVWTGGVISSDLKSYAVPTPDAAMAKPFWTVEEVAPAPSAFTTDNLAKAVALLIGRAKADNAVLDVKGRAALADLETLSASLGKILATNAAPAPVVMVSL